MTCIGHLITKRCDNCFSKLIHSYSIDQKFESVFVTIIPKSIGFKEARNGDKYLFGLEWENKHICILSDYTDTTPQVKIESIYSLFLVIRLPRPPTS